MDYIIKNEKVEITHTPTPKVREYELEQIISIIENINRELLELQERIVDNRERHTLYSAMLPDVEIAIEEKKARIEVEELAKKEAELVAEEIVIDNK